MVPSLSPQESTQRRKDPSEFLMNRMGAPAGEDDMWMNPLDRFSSSYFFRASNSILDREYIGPNGSVNASLRGIW
jgi:hypothetical protein